VVGSILLGQRGVTRGPQIFSGRLMLEEGPEATWPT